MSKPPSIRSLPELPAHHITIYPMETKLYTADQMRAYAEAALTREAPRAGVPDGWKLVPVTPTEAMRTAHSMYGDTSDWWNAVLAATPPAPQQQSAEKECTCKAGEGCTDSCSRGWRRILSEAGQLPPSSRQSVLDFICREMEKLDAPQRHPDALEDGSLSKSTAKRVDALRMAQGEDIPEGWALVPIEPTDEMLDAPNTIIQRYGARLIWKRMLDAAVIAPRNGEPDEH